MAGFFITFITFLVMEAITWCTHKFVMHGFLWNLHEDHHQPEENQVFEKNDLFFVIFAIPAMALMYLGTFNPELKHLFFIGLGITMYGFAYFFVHDIIIHQRIKILTRSNNFYVVAIRKAHKVHHKNRYKEDSKCFGMLWVPISFFREALISTKNARN